MQDIFAATPQSLTQCREKLYEAAQKSDWYDNVTVTFCKITSGKPYVATAATALNNVASKTQSDDTKQPENLKESVSHSVFVIRKSHVRIIIAVAVLLLIIIGAGLFFMLKSKPVQQPAPIEQKAVEQSTVLVQIDAVDDEEIVEEVEELEQVADKVESANVSQKDNKAKPDSPTEAQSGEQEKPKNTAVPMELTLTDSTKPSSSLP